MKKSPKYLEHRNGRWFVRIPIPANLQRHFGKTQFREFLSDRKSDAERKLHTHVSSYLDQIDKAVRGEMIASLKPHEYCLAFYNRYLETIANERGKQLADKARYIEVNVDKLYAPSTPSLTLEEIELQKAQIEIAANEIFDVSWNMRRDNLQKVERAGADIEEIQAIMGWALNELILRKELPSTTTNNQRIEIAQKLALVELLIMETVNNVEHTGLNRETPDNSVFKDDGTLHANSDTSLDDVLPVLHAHRKVASATEKEHETAVRYFHEFLGCKKELSGITASDIREFRNALLELPKNYVQRFPNKTLPEAIKANKSRVAPYSTIDIVTINKKYLSHLRNIFGFALEEGMIETNPAERIKVHNGKKSRPPTRVPFQQPDLDAIFSHKLFEKPNLFGEKQWAILLALYTGARSSSEISKLTTKDIFQTNGIWVIHFSEGTKNESAVHTVPIHNRLINLGFLNYVDRIRKNSNQRLFPKWYGKDTVNRWFIRTFLRKELQIDDKRKVFHSFRHTLKTELTNAGVPQGIRDRIIPHAQDGAAAIYDHSTDESMMSFMQRELNKVVFERI